MFTPVPNRSNETLPLLWVQQNVPSGKILATQNRNIKIYLITVILFLVVLLLSVLLCSNYRNKQQQSKLWPQNANDTWRHRPKSQPPKPTVTGDIVEADGNKPAAAAASSIPLVINTGILPPTGVDTPTKQSAQSSGTIPHPNNTKDNDVKNVIIDEDNSNIDHDKNNDIANKNKTVSTPAEELDEAFEKGRMYWNVNRARRAICEGEPVSDNEIDVYVRTGNYKWRKTIYVAFDPDAKNGGDGGGGVVVVDDTNNNNTSSAVDATAAAPTTTTTEIAKTVETPTKKKNKQKKKQRKHKAKKKYDWKNSSDAFGRCSMFAMNDLRSVLNALSTTFGPVIAAAKHDELSGGKATNATVPATTIDGKAFKRLSSTLRDVESYITLVLRHIHDTVPMKNDEYVGSFNNNKWTNWFQVSVIFPALLAYYLMVPYRLRHISTKVVLDAVRAIIYSPYRSLRYKRDGSNAVAMFGPWLIALIYQYGCDESTYQANVSKNLYYTQIADELTLPEQITPLAKGWHRDASYIAHETCLGFGYLRMMCSPFTNYVYAFDTSFAAAAAAATASAAKMPLSRWRELARVILHPTIARGPPGILNRDSTFLSIVAADATLGCEIMQFGKMLRINGNGGRVIVRGVHAGLGYFETDPTNDRYAQYWVQARAPYTPDMPIEIPPLERAYGIVFGEDETDYTRLCSRTGTTDVFYPNPMSRCYVGVSVEGARERFLMQRYRIDEFGDYDVYELMRFSHLTPGVSQSFIEIDNRTGSRNLCVRLSAEPVRPYNLNAEEARKQLTLYTIPRGKVSVIKHTMNVEDGTIFSRIGESFEKYTSRIPMWERGELLLVAGDETDSWCIDVKRNVVTSNRYGDFSCTGPSNGGDDGETGTLKRSEHDRNNNQTFVWVEKLRSYMRVPRSKGEIDAAKASPIRTLLSTEDDLLAKDGDSNEIAT